MRRKTVYKQIISWSQGCFGVQTALKIVLWRILVSHDLHMVHVQKIEGFLNVRNCSSTVAFHDVLRPESYRSAANIYHDENKEPF